MKNIFLTLVLILGVTHESLASPSPDLSGPWHGGINTGQGILTLQFVFEQDESNTWTGTLESLDQAPGQLIDLDSVSLEEGTLKLAIQRIGARYEATWNADTARWEGQWQQGMAMSLDLERGKPAAKPLIEGLDGAWHGEVDRNGNILRYVIRFVTANDSTNVTLDAPDMLAYGIPVADFTHDRDVVSFTIPAGGISFNGKMNADQTAFSGDWNVPGRADATITFSLGGETETALQRPQHPEPPYPYDAEEVQFENPNAEDVILAGTLTLPKGEGPFPAAVLITGSGPQNRDQELLGHRTFAVIADHLTRNGIAVLRYDDRGFAKSTGSFAEATSADFATDAAAAVQFLQTQQRINPEAIGLIGHSEGGMIAPIVASEHPEVAFMVLLAAPGTKMLDLAMAQRRLIAQTQGVDQAELDRTEPIFRELMHIVAKAPTQENAASQVREYLDAEMLEKLHAPEQAKEPMVQSLTRPWMRFFLRHDPAEFLSQISIPTLALNGDKDLQVPAQENLAAIASAMKSNADFTRHTLESLNHLFQTAETGALGEYRQIEETIAPKVLNLMAEWINARF